MKNHLIIALLLFLIFPLSTLAAQQGVAINWTTDTVSLAADNFYILTNGQTFTANVGGVEVHSDPGSDTYTTLEVTWQEHGVPMRVYMYFESDGSIWQAFEIRFYDGSPNGEWIYFEDTYFTRPLGQAFEETFSLQTGSATLHFENLRLQAFATATTTGAPGMGGQPPMAAATEDAQPPAASPATTDPIRQWAASASASSEYSPTSWSALQATGAPDTGVCGDQTTAWASSSPTGADNLRLSYTQPVIPTQVNIHQTLDPGSITRVELLNSVSGAVFAIPNSADPPGNTPCPGIFTLNISGVAKPVNAVVIYLDQSIVGSWNEIDAVELVGVPMGGPVAVPDTTASTPNLSSGVDVVCDTGANIINGTQVTVIQMRPGFTYTATAIGLNGFDPVLAVLDETGGGLCNDDDATGASYSADLPTTGKVDLSSTSARVRFSQNTGDFEDVSLVVGGYEGQTGEFLLVLEGMAVTGADVVGDPYSVLVTPGMLASNVPVTIYMLANTTALDPLIASVDDTASFYMSDGAGDTIVCDDAGSVDLCWGTSWSLAGASFTNARGRLPGGSMDAMLSIPIADMDPPFEKLTFLMGSFDMASFGDYTIIFHIGIADATATPATGTDTVATSPDTDTTTGSAGVAGAMGDAPPQATEEPVVESDTAPALPQTFDEPAGRLTLNYPDGWAVYPDGDSLIITSNPDFTSPFDSAVAGSGAVVMMLEPSYSLVAEIGLPSDADPQAVIDSIIDLADAGDVVAEAYTLAGESGLQAVFPGAAFGTSTDAKVLVVTSGAHTTTVLANGDYDPHAATIAAILDSIVYGDIPIPDATESAADCPDAFSLPPFDDPITLESRATLPSGISYNYPTDWPVTALSDGHHELRPANAVTVALRLYDTASLANSRVPDEGDATARLQAFMDIFYVDFEQTSINSGTVAGLGYGMATLRDACGNEAQVILRELSNGAYALVDIRNTAGALPFALVDAASQISGSMTPP